MRMDRWFVLLSTALFADAASAQVAAGRQADKLPRRNNSRSFVYDGVVLPASVFGVPWSCPRRNREYKPKPDIGGADGGFSFTSSARTVPAAILIGAQEGTALLDAFRHPRVRRIVTIA